MEKGSLFGPSASVRGARKSAYEGFFLLFLLAISTGLISSSTMTFLQGRPEVALIAGLVFAVSVSLFFAQSLLPSLTATRRFQAIVPLDSESEEGNNVLSVEGYKFSEDISEYLSALKVESSAIYKRYSEFPFFIEGGSKETATVSAEILQQAAEYYILSSLSEELEQYFNNNVSVKKDALQELQRGDIPNFLLSNKFLETFTRPLEDREMFAGHLKPADVPGKVVYVRSDSGAIYEEFNMVLPKRAKIARLGDVGVELKTSYFTLVVKPDLDGFSANLPRGFSPLYLKKPNGSVNVYRLTMVVSVKFAWWSIFTGMGRQYYEWVDGFFRKTDREVNFDTFLRDIGWAQAYTQAIIMLRKKAKEPKKESSEGDGEKPLYVSIVKVDEGVEN